MVRMAPGWQYRIQRIYRRIKCDMYFKYHRFKRKQVLAAGGIYRSIIRRTQLVYLRQQQIAIAGFCKNGLVDIP